MPVTVPTLTDVVSEPAPPPQPNEARVPVQRRAQTPPATRTRVAPRGSSVAALAVGALALGALAFGALAVGRMAIGTLSVRRARVGRVRLDELDIGRLRVRELARD